MVKERQPRILVDTREVGTNNIRTNWLDVWLDANKDFPQTGVGVLSATSHEVLQDLYKRKTTWSKVVTSQLDEMQMARVKHEVAKLHTAFRAEPHLPEGYSHPHSHVIIADMTLQKLWNDIDISIAQFSLVFSLWAEKDFPATLPPITTDFTAEPGENEFFRLTPQDTERLTILFTDKRYKRHVRALLRTTKAMSESLATPEGKALGKKQRDENNSRKPVAPGETKAEDLLNDYVLGAMSKELWRIGRRPFPYLFRKKLEVPENFDKVLRKMLLDDHKLPKTV